MLKYAIILLDDSSTSYCCYSSSTQIKPITQGHLTNSIMWAMKENLAIQFIFPDYELDESILKIVDSVSHIKISSFKSPYAQSADIIVINDVSDILKCNIQFDTQTLLIRTPFNQLGDAVDAIFCLKKIPSRVNFSILDRHFFTEQHKNYYLSTLRKLKNLILESIIKQSTFVETNLLTDRLFLNHMNNCNAGVESITIAPDGNFYECPAFYYEENHMPKGNPQLGINIMNRHLMELKNAPICSHCDSFHCMRCIWLNKLKTHEINTPSKGQCVSSHYERLITLELLSELNRNNINIEGMHNQIRDIDYCDPFDNRKNWEK